MVPGFALSYLGPKLRQYCVLSSRRSFHLSQDFPINVAVVGVGAFGRNHARVYRQLQQAGSVRLVGVVDPDTARADAVAAEFG
ncbi:MAG: Gfo/Idh/MocA family oxidoreductase, partial [Terriglobales bacterium]